MTKENENANEETNPKEDALKGFKMWLDDVGIGQESFNEDHYNFILLMSLFDSYQMQVQQYMRQQEEEARKNGGKKLFVPDDSANKKNGKIIRPDFKNK